MKNGSIESPEIYGAVIVCIRNFVVHFHIEKFYFLYCIIPRDKACRDSSVLFLARFPMPHDLNRTHH